MPLAAASARRRHGTMTARLASCLKHKASSCLPSYENEHLPPSHSP